MIKERSGFIGSGANILKIVRVECWAIQRTENRDKNVFCILGTNTLLTLGSV